MEKIHQHEKQMEIGISPEWMTQNGLRKQQSGSLVDKTGSEEDFWPGGMNPKNSRKEVVQYGTG